MSLERWSKTYFEYLILKSKYLKKNNNNNLRPGARSNFWEN